MPRGRPKKEENLSPQQLWERKVQSRKERKEELFLYLTPDEAMSLKEMMISAEQIKDAYNGLVHPDYGDVVRFDNALINFKYNFWEE